MNLWRGVGFTDPRPYERRFGPPDVGLFRLFTLLAAFVGEDQVLQLMRTMGEAVGRVAEAEVALLRSNIEAPLAEQRQFVDVARTYQAIADDVLPRVLRRARLDAPPSSPGDRPALQRGGAPPSALNVVQLVVGFADLAGYTGLWQEVEPHHLAVMLDRFEAITGDVIAAAGVNVVKRIGDAVMFVTNAPGIVCSLALDLLEACVSAGLPKLRVGVVFGDVMVRQGDFYGPTVNLVVPRVLSGSGHRVRTDVDLQERLALCAVAGYVFVAVGKYNLAGFVEPVEAYQLLRP